MSEVKAEINVQILARRMIHRIEKFGTVEGFSDQNIHDILDAVTKILAPKPALIDIMSPVIVFGDVHGQLADLLRIVKSVSRPPNVQFLLLGDYVDRSGNSLEVIMWLFCMNVLFPEYVHMLRGNHEIRRINACYGFLNEMRRKRDVSMWKRINDVFCELPLVAAISRRILCMHGGLSPNIQSWKTLEDMEKPVKHRQCELPFNVDLMWSDPSESSTDVQFNSTRGIGCLFGEKLIDSICEKLDIFLIIRGHEMQLDGHKFLFNNRLLSIFSAANYEGGKTNSASVVKVSKSLKIQIVTIKPKRTAEELSQMNKTDNTAVCTGSCQTRKKMRWTFVGSQESFGHDTKNCLKSKPVKSTGSRRSRGNSRREGRRIVSKEGIDTLEETMNKKLAQKKEDTMSLSSLRRTLTQKDLEKKDKPASSTGSSNSSSATTSTSSSSVSSEASTASTEKSSDKSNEKPSEKTAEKQNEKSGEKPVDKSKRKPTKGQEASSSEDELSPRSQMFLKSVLEDENMALAFERNVKPEVQNSEKAKDDGMLGLEKMLLTGKMESKENEEKKEGGEKCTSETKKDEEKPADKKDSEKGSNETKKEEEKPADKKDPEKGSNETKKEEEKPADKEPEKSDELKKQEKTEEKKVEEKDGSNKEVKPTEESPNKSEEKPAEIKEVAKNEQPEETKKEEEKKDASPKPEETKKE